MLNKILFLLFLLFSLAVQASVNITELDIGCGDKNNLCEFYKERIQGLKAEYQIQEELVEALKSYSHLEGIKDFKFKLYLMGADKYRLSIIFQIQTLVSEIVFKNAKKLNIDSVDLGFSEGSFVDLDIINSSRFVIMKKLVEKGYPHAQVSYEISQGKDGASSLIYNVKRNRALVVDRIRVDINNKRNLFRVESVLRKLKGKPYNRNTLNMMLARLKTALIDDGYLQTDFTVTENIIKNGVHLKVKFDVDTLYAFEFNKNEIKVPHELKKEARSLFLQSKGMPSESEWKSHFSSFFKRFGYLDVQISYHKRMITNSYYETVVISNFVISLSKQYNLLPPVIIGNTAITTDQIQDVFYDSSNELIQSKRYDENYVKEFSKRLLRFYYSKGYVGASVFSPIITINRKKHHVFVSYKVNEGDMALIDSIDIKGVDREIEQELLDVMSLKQKGAFDPMRFGSDLIKITDYLKAKGYYFARVSNLRDPSIVSYLNDQTTVKISIDIDFGDKVNFGRYYVIGNNKTKEIIFKRQIQLVRGELVTPSKIIKIQNRLLATGLFESVRINPIKISNQLKNYDLIVKVIEKKYGAIELAPGFRTDLGLKISTSITRSNLSGLNKSIGLNALINRRTDDLTLDPTRASGTRMLEYDFRLSYLENDLFKSTYIDYEAGFSVIRKRYYSFDADIERVSQKLSRVLSDHYTVSLGYQLENIKQYDGVSSIHEGQFRIGTITPSVQMDYRDNAINPRKGALMNLSVEIGNPFFLSQKESNLEINYYKFVSRNAFYVPVSKKWTLANSVAFGLQENLAKNGAGYIPNIKVFRLSGIDAVRGFDDEEINSLISGTDISDQLIDNKAYIVNFKFEPRYRFSPNLVAGVFYDAGRVFVDDLNLSELRSSVGVTFKYVTPVGTLDFDYGIKLLRKTSSSGKKESPGRFHLSIGFF